MTINVKTKLQVQLTNIERELKNRQELNSPEVNAMLQLTKSNILLGLQKYEVNK